MRKRTVTTALGAGLIALLGLVGCASGTPGQEGGEVSEAPVATDVALEGSPTYDRMKAADKIVIGVKEDQPGLGYLDAVSGKRTGFDIDIARWMAAELGFGEDKIEFKAIPSANRETAIVNGDIDLYVGTYSITDKRKAQIDFAGPYFLTGQGLLVKSDSTITGVDDLNESTNVCSATGSTPIQNIRDNYPGVPVTEFDTYSQCVEALLNGQVQAVTTDQAILLGYAAQDPDNLKVVGEPFSEEKYGIGLPKGDDVLRNYLNDALENGNAKWQEIYDANLGSTGVKVEQPAVDRY
ncbi:glutamate ABC transporter substrate-binding protein [Pseudoclavibacter chungangensis]|uniref:Glutamate ABC transporter substrate-binding protein n=1 Tax=Pseudoclavibacter chungangensis TaxID=587635 RepID=A0A7J5BN86_9MICO|nr:glutamate ABC transporter substrate-binding protein [Pseudoclavibacter chungangensis]KAB1653120.1 glutamate ABC transporter substrate-binding protein [Pseudoclavibacter chungangensis]NYJ66991.1 glutamate transport system substrate-binding protein [Pseudoclavibacter chungangensis]